MNSTGQLWKVLDTHSFRESTDRPLLPKLLIDSLRKALEAGMTCEHIAASLHLMVGLNAMESGMDSVEVVARCQEISRVIQGDQAILDAQHNLAKGEWE